jgi:hypothetical protein
MTNVGEEDCFVNACVIAECLHVSSRIKSGRYTYNLKRTTYNPIQFSAFAFT